MEKIKFGPQTLLYPMPAVLVGANINEKPNFMTAAWCAIAAHKPPAVSVAIRKERYTLEGVRENATFSINVPSSDMVKKTDYCGVYSGKKNDKSQIFKVFYGDLKNSPPHSGMPVKSGVYSYPLSGFREPYLGCG
jgi:flavin reductase (DIM6/NTAB) family NADH-FMN oxidoreductase RutF